MIIPFSLSKKQEKLKKFTPKKFLIYQENQALMFWEMELSSPKIKKSHEGTFRTKKNCYILGNGTLLT